MPARSLANIELVLNAKGPLDVIIDPSWADFGGPMKDPASLPTDLSTDLVRCPECRKAIAESLEGRLTLTCPRCRHRVTIVR